MESAIDGVVIRALGRFEDARGHLTELFRSDELPEGFFPAMGYLSFTKPGISRGPHEHVHQTDGFAFLDGAYELHLWDNRPNAGRCYEVHQLGSENRAFVTIPPGVVHGYRNVGNSDAMVLNFPNQLYAGQGKAETVDEIRYESNPSSPFKL